MIIKPLFISARSACIELPLKGYYHADEPAGLRLNEADYGQADRVVTSLFGLAPDTAYHLEMLQKGRLAAEVRFRTKAEFVTLNVRDFGAFGDGTHDDTAAIQAAILCCPKESRVLVPTGKYLVSPLFLKSHLRLEIQKGAQLRLHPAREESPILPGMIPSWDEKSEYNLGTWEGNPLSMHAALLTAVDAHDIEVYGEGVLDGQAAKGDWWLEPKVKKSGAWRGRMVFLNRCQNVTLQGLTITNSPSWNVHPYFSKDLVLLDLSIQSPSDSPNTDGINPESCRDVLISGARLSVGDDCIAIKSGKIYMGATYKTPTERVTISHCLMENGHGGVTIGSEMAGGVRDILVTDCRMLRTDRALRIKTRRGRGKQGVIDRIHFENVKMIDIPVPIAINSFYHCDPDGHAKNVQDKEARPADDGTPVIGALSFNNVVATGCRHVAVYALGLPEKKIRRIAITNSRFSFAEEKVVPARPVMADGVELCAKRGLIAHNVENLALSDVAFWGTVGETLELHGVDSLIKEDEL